MGWDDAPSHICRGGDVRGLAFCCPPVKPCPVMNALREVGITPQEYINIKEDFAKNTRLGEGAGTCFGSLVWCCKTSKPCPLRDMVLRNINMSHLSLLWAIAFEVSLLDKMYSNEEGIGQLWKEYKSEV